MIAQSLGLVDFTFYGARQFAAAGPTLNTVACLVRCATLAVERTVSEKAPHGSPVPDDALHTTIKALHKVYFDYAADPRKPGKDIGEGSAESATWRESELLDFLSAALQPLGVKRKREAICSLWRRATKEEGEESPPP